jgi:hypothetical protein
VSPRIIYLTDDNTVAIIIPTPEALSVHSVMEVALKDVPAGKPFKIVDSSVIPSDRTFRLAWEVDVSSLTDGIGSQSNKF